jgi:hypothetical protein
MQNIQLRLNVSNSISAFFHRYSYYSSFVHGRAVNRPQTTLRVCINRLYNKAGGQTICREQERRNKIETDSGENHKTVTVQKCWRMQQNQI